MIIVSEFQTFLICFKVELNAAHHCGAELVASKPYSFSQSIKGQNKNIWTISFSSGGITKIIII